MLRLQILLPLVLWGVWRGVGSDAARSGAWCDPWTGTATYLCGLVGILAAMRLRARLTMRRASRTMTAPVPGFYRTITLARHTLLLWHAAALFFLGYGDLLLSLLGHAEARFEGLAAAISVLPLLTAWAGLWWTQYPLERAVREQNALVAFELGEPVHAVPTLGQYLGHAVRTQMLAMLAPTLAVWVLYNGVDLAAGRMMSARDADVLGTVVAVGSAVLLSPELLRRVLPTRSLPPSALRDRLEDLCRRARLRFGDILLWHTHYTLGNAAVMGVLPRVRYVLLTDLLLDTMTADQVESVFAHELGHVFHRHLVWYVLYWLMAMMGLTALGDWAVPLAARSGWLTDTQADGALTVGGLVGAVVLFGVLSRMFERQADFFAARSLTEPGDSTRPARDGTAVFVSALRQVAITNNMPLDATAMVRGRRLAGRWVGRITHHLASWMHGSIRSRMEHVYRLTTQPAAARRFDRTMFTVRCAMLVGISATVAWAVVGYLRTVLSNAG